MSAKHKLLSVLVVDDEPFILKTTEFVLRRLGYEHVISANTAKEALELINQTSPPVGLVLSDLNMPDIDGVELLRRFEDVGYEGDIVLFSGEDNQTLSMAESLARARNLSVLGSISKPIDPAVLSELLNKENEAKNGPMKSSPTVITEEILKSAIEAGEIEPWFQPKIDVKTKEPSGVEALARWHSPALGQVFPDAFIPAAENYHLIDQLTFALVKKVIKYQDDWHKNGIDLKVAINVSMDSLGLVDFPDQLEKIINTKTSGFDAIQLEVTESKLMSDLVKPLEVLLRLRLKRIKLAIDDFGTGHSNLSQLRDLPFDELKLDRSYIQGHSSKLRSDAILESSVEIAKKLNMTIVAEGVETREDWDRVEQLGCDQVQGYYTARPMPADEIVTWVKAWPELRKELFK